MARRTLKQYKSLSGINCQLNCKENFLSEILFPVQKLKSAGTEVSPGVDPEHFPHAGAGYTYQKRASMSKPTQHSPPPWQLPLPQSADPTVPGGGGEGRGGAGGGGEAQGGRVAERHLERLRGGRVAECHLRRLGLDGGHQRGRRCGRS